MARSGSTPSARQEGASLVEYALIVGLVAVVVLGAVSRLGGGSSGALTEAGGGLERSPVAPAPGGGGGGGGGGPTSGGGSGSGSTTTTTAGTSTTTSTTSPPSTIPTTTTTTTTTPSTTAPRATVAEATFTDPEVSHSRHTWWVTTSLTVMDDLGRPVAGARATIEVRYYVRQGWGGRWVEDDVEVTTNEAGVVVLDSGALDRSDITRLEAQLEEVSMPGDLSWDGSQPSLSARAP